MTFTENPNHWAKRVFSEGPWIFVTPPWVHTENDPQGSGVALPISPQILKGFHDYCPSAEMPKPALPVKTASASRKPSSRLLHSRLFRVLYKNRCRVCERDLRKTGKRGDEPVNPGSDFTRGKAALRVMSRTHPEKFAQLYAGLLPREFVFENVAHELDDVELDKVIEGIRARLIETREERALDQAAQMKLVEHVRQP